MTLLSRIKELCAEKSITLAALEKTLNFGNGSLSRWDSSSPSSDKLQKVADYFNVSTDYLLGRDDKGKLEGVYFRLAKGAQELGLDDSDVDAILNLYKQHQDRNK